MKKLLLALVLSLCAFTVMAADKVVKIGAIFSETGPASFLGYPEKLTAEMLIKKINAAGGINGYTFELIAHDTQGQEQRGISYLKKLIVKDGVLAIVGPSTTGVTLAVKRFASQYKTPLISCAASKTIVDPVDKYIFKTPQSDTHAVAAIYKDILKAGGKKVAILTAQNGFGKTGRDALIETAKEMGLDVVADEKFSDSDKNMTAQLSKIIEAKADAVVCWGVGPAPAIVARNAKQLGITNLYMSHGVASKKFIELAGDAANGIKLPAGRIMVIDQLAENDKFKPVLTAYKNEFEKETGLAISAFGGYGYDSIMLFMAAFEKSGPDKDKLAEELEKIKGFTGTTGEFNMSPTDHNGLGNDSFVMTVINEGEFKITE